MTYKEYCETQDVTYITIAYVNGNRVAKLTTLDTESLQGQSYKLSNAVEKELTKQYEELAESEEV